MRLAGKTLIFFLLLVAGALWLWHEASVFLNTPPEKNGRPILFEVRQGAPLQEIAASLQEKGLITDSRKFGWLARCKQYGNRLQTGRFALNTGWKPEQILETLANGREALHRITIPEGLTWWQTGNLLANEGFLNFEDFARVIRDPAFLRHYGIPFATAEGFLMPDTYFLKKPDDQVPDPRNAAGSRPSAEDGKLWARQIAGRMVDNFWRKTAGLWPPEGGAVSGGIYRPARNDLRRWTTLASIVEKETGLEAERGKVAGVYANRLAGGMLLQADPTVIYGLGKDFSGRLRRSQLDDAGNPYNTYKRPGLPPGPICSFGVAALKAAIRPEKHDYLYFVATQDGGAHTFSKTLEGHNQAVREYRRKKKEQ